MIYRLANEKDLEMLAEMRWLHEYDENGSNDMIKTDFMPHCKEFLKEGLEKGNWAYWIAEDNGVIVSNIYVCRIRKVPKPKRLFTEIGYVTNVHTKAEYRNKGIGSELLKNVKQWTLENEIELLFVWPSERSVNFYERNGFADKNEIMELLL